MTHIVLDPVFQPHSNDAFQRGINTVVNSIRPTLGPLPRAVAIQSTITSQPPELLDNGGLIARRMIALPDRDEDVGAMFVRGMLCELHQEFGDGIATAAVMFQAIYREARQYIASGGDAMRLRLELERLLPYILNELDSMTCLLAEDEHGRIQQLKNVAVSVCPDSELASMIADILDATGAYGRLDIRSGYGRTAEVEYFAGCYFDGGSASGKLHQVIAAPAILYTDLTIDSVEQLLPVLTQIVQAGYRALVIVARTFSDSVLSFLNSNSRTEKFQVMAVKAPGQDILQRMLGLEDMTRLTGGFVLASEAGDSLGNFRISALGHAESVWATADSFGIVGGKGDLNALETFLQQLHAKIPTEPKLEKREALQKRIGRLTEGAVTLWVGGVSAVETVTRRSNAERAVQTMRAALREGVLPGGGLALLRCQKLLEPSATVRANADQRAARRILQRALEEPLRTLVANAGHEPAQVLARLKLCGPDFGFDALSGKILGPDDYKIFDAAAILKAAVHRAISSAALAVTIDVVIHPRRRITSTEPN